MHEDKARFERQGALKLRPLKARVFAHSHILATPCIQLLFRAVEWTVMGPVPPPRLRTQLHRYSPQSPLWRRRSWSRRQRLHSPPPRRRRRQEDPAVGAAAAAAAAPAATVVGEAAAVIDLTCDQEVIDLCD
jgi:hypothetical protein